MKKQRAEMLKNLTEVINQMSDQTPWGETNSWVWTLRTIHQLIESLNNESWKSDN